MLAEESATNAFPPFSEDFLEWAELVLDMSKAKDDQQQIPIGHGRNEFTELDEALDRALERIAEERKQKLIPAESLVRRSNST